MPTPSPPIQTERHPVPVMFAVTSSWLVPLAVTLYSLCLHTNPRRLYEIQIVHDGLKASERKELRKAISGHPHISVHFVTLPEKLFQSLQNRDCGRFSSLSYVRLLAASLFPQYDRLLYLDVDILLNGDVAELYDTDLQGKPVAAVRDCAALQSISTGKLASHLEYLNGMGITFPLLYCNAGVMVMDLRQMRQKGMENTLLRILRSRPDSFPYADQDILNIAFHGNMMPLPVEWNYHFQFELHHQGMQVLIAGTEFEKVHALFNNRSWKLFHLVGGYKPWLPPDMEKIYHRLYLSLWWPAARQTPAFRSELRSLYREFTHSIRSRMRRHQWRLLVSPGKVFRKRRIKIKGLQRLLAVFDGNWQ